jgi:hypothetical protein
MRAHAQVRTARVPHPEMQTRGCRGGHVRFRLGMNRWLDGRLAGPFLPRLCSPTPEPQSSNLVLTSMIFRKHTWSPSADTTSARSIA